MNILGYFAKRTLIDAVSTLLASDTVDVQYSFPADPGRTVVYGGAVRGSQSDAVAEAGVLTYDVATIDLWIRYYLPGDDVRGTDQVVEALADQIIGYLGTNPHLTGGLTVTGVAGYDAGQPTLAAQPEPAVVAQLLLQIVVEGDI